MLLAFPIEVSARGRYEAGFAAGFGMELDGAFKGGLDASAMMTDYGPSFEYAGGEGTTASVGETAPQLLLDGLRGALLSARDPKVGRQLHQVRREVIRVLYRR